LRKQGWKFFLGVCLWVGLRSVFTQEFVDCFSGVEEASDFGGDEVFWKRRVEGEQFRGYPECNHILVVGDLDENHV